jgi:hydrogenase expression/formation protein HypC
MCLGVPGKIIETFTSTTGMKMGRVSFSGVVKDVCLEYEPDAEIGDYVIVHVGFAISRLDPDEAMELLDYLVEIDESAEVKIAQPKSVGQ